jgi:predicted nucleic-acid-binding Zn-ribbon protein
MKDGVCAKCGAREVYKQRDGAYGLNVPISMFSKTLLELYVCAECGYIEFYVQSEEKLKQIPETFKKVE